MVRTCIILAVHAAGSAIIPIVSVARIELDGVVVIGYCLLILALPDARDGSKVVNVLDIGVQTDGLAGILFGSHVVVQIVFGDGAVLPRLVKVRPK